MASILSLPGWVTKSASNTWSFRTAHITCSLAVNCVVYCYRVAKPSLTSPVQYGWTENAVGFSPLVTKLDPAPVAVVELVRCNCSSSKCYTNRWSCKKMNMVCTDLCKCAVSEQYECENVDSSNGGHNSDAEGVEDSGQSWYIHWVVYLKWTICFWLCSGLFILSTIWILVWTTL